MISHNVRYSQLPKRTIQLYRVLLILFAASVFFSGCGGGSKGTPVTTTSGTGASANLVGGKQVGALGLAAKAEVRGLVESLPFFESVTDEAVPALTKGKYLLPEGVSSVVRSSMTATRELTGSYVSGVTAYVSANFTLSGTLTFKDSTGSTVNEKPISMTAYGSYVLEQGADGSWKVVEDATENLEFSSGGSVSIQEVKYEPAFAGPGDTQKIEATIYNPSSSELYITGKINSLGLKAVLVDDGTGADFTANDGIYTAQYTIPSTVAEGQYVGVLDIIDKTQSFDLTNTSYTGMIVTQPMLVGSIQSLTLTSNATTATAGEYVYFLAEGALGSGTVIDLTNDVTWTSSDTSVGDVYGPGYFYGFSSGTTNISASLGTLTSNSISVTVTASATGGGTGSAGAFGAPANLVALPSADGEVTLYWDLVPDAVSYNVYMASQTGVSPANYASLPDGMTHMADFPYYVHLGLTNGKTYYFVVTAVDASGVESSASTEVSAMPSSSGGGAVGGVNAVPGDSSVTVYWEAIPGATSYMVYIASQTGVTSSNYSTLTDGNVVSGIVDTFYTFTGLTNGTTYYFVVVGTDGTNVTPDSPEAYGTPGAGGGGGGASTCGDTYCDATAGEDATTCSVDCTGGGGTPPPACGDTFCDASIGETTITCAVDCGGGGGSCGNGTCESALGEDATTCSVDCTGGGGTPPPACGDAYCDASIGETTITCAPDCGARGSCGDAYCDASIGESIETCPVDCGGGGTPPSACGDTFCDASIGETTITCAPDCGGGGGLSAPTGVFASAADGQVAIYWDPVAGASSYNLYMAEISGVTQLNYTSLPGGMSHPGVTSPYTHTGLTNGTTYYFVVTAFDGATESGDSIEAIATPSGGGGGLAAPTGVSASPGDMMVSLTWDPVAGATGYTVYTSTSPAVSKTIYDFSTGVGATTSTTVTGLTNGTTYYFVVTAYDGGGESAESSPSVFATPVGGGGLSAPTGVSASPGDGNVPIMWNSVSGATSYNIYFATVAGVTAANYTGLPGGAAMVGVVSTSEVIAGLTNGMTYYFVVTAFDGTTESAESAEVSATPAAGIPAPANLMATPGNGDVSLSWDPAGSAFEYHVYYASVPGVTAANYTGLPDGGTTTVFESLTTMISPLTNDVTYYFVVTAVDGVESTESNEVSATPTGGGLTAPMNAMAMPGPANGEIDMSWDVVAGATSYYVYYSTTPGVTKATYEGVMPTASNFVTLTGLTPGATYYLVVTAYDGVTESVESTEVSTTAQFIAMAPGGPKGKIQYFVLRLGDAYQSAKQKVKEFVSL